MTKEGCCVVPLFAGGMVHMHACARTAAATNYAWRLAGAVNVMAGPGTLVQDTTVLYYWSNVCPVGWADKAKFY